MSSEDTSIATSSLTEPEVMSAPAIPVYLPTTGTSSSRKKEDTARILPNIMVTNHRSIFPKFNNLIDELIECEMHLGIQSEILENNENVELLNFEVYIIYIIPDLNGEVVELPLHYVT
jgi:hypothetical protein